MSPLIVVIEDDRPMIELLRDLLELQGFSVLAIPDPTLIQCIEPNLRPDLILIDMMLPEKSGIEIAQDLREQGFAHTPMIALSASRLMAEAAEESSMFQSAMVKPFDYDELFKEIRRLLGTGSEG